MPQGGSGLHYPIIAGIEADHPFDAVFVAEHAEVGAAKTIGHGDFYVSTGREAVEKVIGFLLAFGAYCNFTAVLVLADFAEKGGDIVCHEHVVLADGQCDVHELIFIIGGDGELGGCNVFETGDLCKLPAKNRAVECKCFVGIAVEVDVRIDECHCLCFFS